MTQYLQTPSLAKLMLNGPARHRTRCPQDRPNHPRNAALSIVNTKNSEPKQAFNLHSLIVRMQIDVEAVLRHLCVAYGKQSQEAGLVTFDLKDGRGSDSDENSAEEAVTLIGEFERVLLMHQ